MRQKRKEGHGDAHNDRSYQKLYDRHARGAEYQHIAWKIDFGDQRAGRTNTSRGRHGQLAEKPPYRGTDQREQRIRHIDILHRHIDDFRLFQHGEDYGGCHGGQRDPHIAQE